MMLTQLLQILASTIGSLSFAILFNIRGNKLIAVAVGGGCGWALFLFLNHMIESETISYFVVAMVISLYAELMARVLKAPTTIFIAPSLIPLVPGASLYYTMVYALEGDSNLFTDKALSTLKLASALAVGVVTSAVLMKILTQVFQMIHKKAP